MKLKWLEIERFRNVRPGTRLEFDDDVNVVLGRNGTGKTTLLRLIEAVVSHNYAAFEEEPFSIAASLVDGDGSLEVKVTNTPQSPTAETLSDATHRQRRTSGASTWALNIKGRSPELGEWELSSSPSKSTLALTEDDHDLPDLRPLSPFEEGSLKDLAWALIERSSTFDSPLGELADRGSLNCRFDESTEMFDRVVGQSGAGKHPQIRIIEISPGVVIGSGSSFFPIDGFNRSLLASVNLDDTVLKFSEEKTGYLKSMADLIGARSVMLHIGRSSLSGRPGRRVAVYDGVSFHVTFASGLSISHHHLSYGQKRLLAFIYYLATVPGPVIADELVNGFHHTWIEGCLDLIRREGMQSFLTSQNPLLIDYLEFESAEAAQRAFILCDLEGDEFVWRQMTDDEAQSFYAAYETGVQHVGDILRTKGLW